MLSLYAQKLLAWFGLYKISAAEYYAHLNNYGIEPHGEPFTTAFNELVTYGY